jgi:hypothetical protein
MRNLNVDRAAGNTLRILAGETSHGLIQCCILIVTESYFLEVMSSDCRILNRHFILDE